MEEEEPPEVVAGQQLVIDCAGNEFTMYSDVGNLTMGRGSSLHYVNCQLQNYLFPEAADVANTVHLMSNSTFNMQSCRFVRSLNKQYAPLIVELQQNATFDLGGLVDKGGSAAVHIFAATFDSLLGPQYRYEIFNTTAHCGPDDGVASQAFQLAISNSPDVIEMSPDVDTTVQAGGVAGEDAVVDGDLAGRDAVMADGDAGNGGRGGVQSEEVPTVAGESSRAAAEIGSRGGAWAASAAAAAALCGIVLV